MALREIAEPHTIEVDLAFGTQGQRRMAEGTILYIEDDDDSRVLVERILTRPGYRVLVAARALQGIDLAQQHLPDLILADINLPDLSGREIAVRLRADPRLADVPIVALTAYTDRADREKTLAAGVTGYLTKPIDPHALPEIIAGYLSGKRDTVGGAAAASAREAYSRELVDRLEKTVRELEFTNRELRRIDAIKDDFIQLTAHELRTPLTTVYGYSRLVQTAPVFRQAVANDPDAAEALDGLIASVERLQLVVEEIITVSRIALGRVDLRIGPANLRAIIEQVLAEYARVIRQRRLTLAYDLDEWPRSMLGDAALLELAFSNILGNAIKYTPDGGTITLRAVVKGGRLKISVADTGVGIAPEDQEVIFDRFYTAGDTQLHSTSKTAFRGGGLGLGLAICRGIVTAHGGRLWVESPGSDPQTLPGSTFHIELPIPQGRAGQMSHAL